MRADDQGISSLWLFNRFPASCQGSGWWFSVGDVLVLSDVFDALALRIIRAVNPIIIMMINKISSEAMRINIHTAAERSECGEGSGGVVAWATSG